MGRNCLFVRKGEKRKKKGLIKKFLSPSFLLCPTFSLSPNCLKSCDSHNLQSALQQTTDRDRKETRFSARPTVSNSVCLERRSSNNLSKIAVLLLSFRHEGVWPGSLLIQPQSHWPHTLRSVAARSRRQTRTTGGEREIDRRSAPPTPRRDKFLFFHPERARRKGERKR